MATFSGGIAKKKAPMPSCKPPPLPENEGFERLPGSRHGSRTPSPLRKAETFAQQVLKDGKHMITKVDCSGKRLMVCWKI
jgi:hypothetical protein